MTASDCADHVAFLFTDIEGSSVKWLRHTGAMHSALAEHDQILRSAIAAAGGEVFKTAGDAFYAAFSDASAAIDAAVAAQRALKAADWRPVDGLKVRMAVHLGSAKKRDDDYFGPALNHCARLLVLGHGGQILITTVVADVLAAAGSSATARSRPIGASPLDDPKLEAPIHQVISDGLEDDFPPLRDPTIVPNNLPRHLTPLIGRDAECLSIEAALNDSRLVTLTGSGGVGKTRLALEAGVRLTTAGADAGALEGLRQRFKAGVWLGELAPLAEANILEGAIAGAIGIELSDAASPTDVLVSRLKNESLLLILDNCEHLIEGVARLSDTLLGRCRWLQILATSQQPLAIGGEVVLQLQPLDLPAGETPSAVEAMASAAVALFVARARAADSRFRLNDGNAPTVAAICRRLDGVALAIEMAASRVSAFGVAALSKSLDQRFAVLTSGARTALPRQQTLLATLDWSHGLLEPREREVLRRLSIFSGGFSLEAASAVVSGGGLRGYAVTDAILNLTNRSLIAAVLDDGRTRYRLLETTREFAREKLAAAEETQTVAAAHAVHVREVMETCHSESFVISDTALRDAFGPEIGNVRAALNWALAKGGDEPLGLAILGAAGPLFSVLSLLPELRGRLEDAARRLTASTPPDIAARICVQLGHAYGFSNPAKAYDALAAAAPFYRSTGDERLLGEALIFMGRFAQVVAAHAQESAALIAEAGPMILRSGGKRLEGHLFRALGNEAANVGDFARSVAMMRRSQQAFVEAGADGAASAVVTSLGYMLWASGHIDLAIEVCRAILAQLRERRFADGPVLGFSLGNLAAMLIERGDLAEARALVDEAVPLLTDPWQLWVIFDHVSLLLAKEGRHSHAARGAGFSDAFYRRRGAVRQANEARAHASLLAMLENALGRARLDEFITEGALLREAEAAALACPDTSTD